MTTELPVAYIFGVRAGATALLLGGHGLARELLCDL